jgi:hypothetical protein
MGELSWSYLGWRRFPRELRGFELRRFDALDHVPKSLLEYAAYQLTLPAPELATLRAGGRAGGS